MKRRRVLILGLLTAAVVVTGVSAQDKAKKAVYTITTKNLSVGIAAYCSLPLTLGYWTAEGADIEEINKFHQAAVVRQAKESR